MIKFSDLNFRQVSTYPFGKQALAFFPNGYGVSVIQNSMSYGHEEGLYELAVIKGDEDAWILTYETPVTGDVIGRLTESDVALYANMVQALV